MHQNLKKGRGGTVVGGGDALEACRIPGGVLTMAYGDVPPKLVIFSPKILRQGSKCGQNNS